MTKQIILKELQKPVKIDLHEDIAWLGESLGFLAGKSSDDINSKILWELLREISERGNTRTETLSRNLNISVQRVNYHLRNLFESGFIFREKRVLHIRQGSVSAAIEEIRKDANRIFDTLEVIAAEIDKKLGFKTRKI